ncbi:MULTISPECIES: hemerythrin domain-containing protein [unclassified Legionella]|uniref:hemerythrin domain-containing protein n=1 Tax=unclassified Legionella TaxID=2622702 RepID=UPI001E4A1134|nr:hemerythrin domain-containing protein [Legionella sp. 31fI33]MCC5013881.1 hemerythrin domain-containing protein [Legionella sp. 31fI33]
MDIYDYLKMDHDKVEHLFKLFEDSKIVTRKKEIVALIAQELLVHAHAEQETLYRRLAEHPQTNEIALHGEKEHREIEDQINKVIQSKVSGKNWEKAVLKLKEIVEHHVREEEGELFNQAKKIISSRQAVVIKEKMHYLKGKFLLWLEKTKEEVAVKAKPAPKKGKKQAVKIKAKTHSQAARDYH